MAAKAKAGAAGKGHTPGKPKTTSQGTGRGSRPARKGKKRQVGQGR